MNPLKAGFSLASCRSGNQELETWEGFDAREFFIADMKGAMWQRPESGLSELRVFPGQKLDNGELSPTVARKWILPAPWGNTEEDLALAEPLEMDTLISALWDFSFMKRGPN